MATTNIAPGVLSGPIMPTARPWPILSTMVGAVVLSRAVNDKRLSKQFLHAAAESVMELSAGAAQKGQLR
jgi:TetR/AcrR family transcriptional regulator, transcriptional repressor for nem operon